MESDDGNTGAVIGLVLAGGRSRRMGLDKATLRLEGETLVARAARVLGAVFGEVAIADAGRGYLPGLRSLPDGPGAGPAAGLLGAANSFPGRSFLALACDLPFVTPALLARIAEEHAFDLVIPEGPAGLEPLCALYAPRALDELARRVSAGHLALHELAGGSGLRIRRLSVEEVATLGLPGAFFRNWNEPGDLE